MSRSGCLLPPRPVKLLLKYSPPKLTIVYHFEKNEKEEYFHDVIISTEMLENKSDDEICSHLYM